MVIPPVPRIRLGGAPRFDPFSFTGKASSMSRGAARRELRVFLLRLRLPGLKIDEA
jgi:hypothetical protein